KNGELPFALHLSFKDTKEVVQLVKVGDQFFYDSQTNQLKSNAVSLSFKYTHFYHSQMLPQQEIMLKQVEKVLAEAEMVSENNGFQKNLPLSLDDAAEPEFANSIKGLFSSDKEG